MRLSDKQIAAIRKIVAEEAGAEAKIRLFGSRLHDELRGGDLDLLVSVDTSVSNPAWLAARLEALISRAMDGRSVDVVLEAPNLRHDTIHKIAREEGIPL
ncbi:nucleotidyltransferase domain-containing protein [Thiohalophilus sp.]|uniref:nucleotidyltransferase domain-containing protein n=1 Tax=Thiohalophilus sp. TaxID=3028392 RepID=UPI002ACE230C|nr:nucleotidyltransferase domain-containing protein [Thiohalophilus sp.]MDZ7804377.1 nucleotidyltransferase domain-containing protein [Thiohalophilus sp.]